MLKRLFSWFYAAAYDLFNRDTLAEIEASPLAVEWVRAGELPKAPRIERPMIQALAARRPAPNQHGPENVACGEGPPG